MAYLDMKFQRLYQNRLREGNSLRTDDILGAKPKRGVRERDPEAFDKMTRVRVFESSGGSEALNNVRPGAKNLDHYQRLMKNLPGGPERWEGMYSKHRGKIDNMTAIMSHNENLVMDRWPADNQEKFELKAPYYREEKSSPPMFKASSPDLRAGGSMNSNAGPSRLAAEQSLAEPRANRFGQPVIDGIRPERLPALPHPTRFRSPQPVRGTSDDMPGLTSQFDQPDNAAIFPGGRKGRGGMNPAVYENRAQHRQVFDYNYNQMKDTLEYRQEKGLLFRHTSPDNPLQMAAGRRLNKSFDQSTNPNYRDVDFVKNIFDKGDTSLGDKNNFGSFKPSVVEGTGSKGMFLSRKQEGKQQGQVRRPQEVSKGPRDDAQFVKNAGLFF